MYIVVAPVVGTLGYFVSWENPTTLSCWIVVVLLVPIYGNAAMLKTHVMRKCFGASSAWGVYS